MVGAAAAADAVARARRLPRLHVGLHLVLVDGHPVLADAEIPALVRHKGQFDQNLTRAGIRFFFLPHVRGQLAMEIRAQFEAFRATGLQLDHVNAHKHMHLHPSVAELIIEIGCGYGMKALRVPSEPIAVLRRAFPDERYRNPPYRFWVDKLRRRSQRAGLYVTDHVFGLAWSGGVVEERVLRLIPHLPDGVSEIYFHPAAESVPSLVPGMPRNCQQEELAALLSPILRSRIAELGIRLVAYSDLTAAAT
jgi:chitin disaccharide deacetylase